MHGLVHAMLILQLVTILFTAFTGFGGELESFMVWCPG